LSSNLPPIAKEKYQEYLDAGSLEEKIKKLEEFLSLVPKHKATEKIVALNRSRLAKMKREVEEKRQRQKSMQKVVSPFSIKKEGVQIILISDYHTPGVGKTSLLNYLTGAAEEKIGKFTSIPEIGIYENSKIRYQIVDMPSIMEGASKGIGNGREILSQLRSCDLLCFCIDLSRDYKEQIELLLKEISSANIRINLPPPPISIEKTGSNKIQVYYLTKKAKKNEDIDELTERIREIIEENGIRNAIVKVYGKIKLGDVVDALNPSVIYQKAIIIATKGDLPNTQDKFEMLKMTFSNEFPIIIGISVVKNEFPNNFGDLILKILEKVKIYTMANGKVAEKPLVMDSNPTVKDVALKVHKSLYEMFDHAIIIRERARQKKKKVGLKYELKDNDIIEIYTR
jgi:ribosome-interacting GTPase 1